MTMLDDILGFDPFAPQPSPMRDYLEGMRLGGGWRGEAAQSILRGSYGGDPDYVPRYRIPARRWPWQFWKPKWKAIMPIANTPL